MIAQGLVHPKTAEEKIHCVDLAEDLVRVYVTEVPEIFRHFNVKYPPNPECVTLGQCEGHLIKWEKSYILLSATSTQTCQPPATIVTPTGPSPFGTSAPQTFENDGGSDAGGDMAVDKEQLVGDTSPLHQPATKTKPSTSAVPEKGCNSTVDGPAMAVKSRKNRTSQMEREKRKQQKLNHGPAVKRNEKSGFLSCQVRELRRELENMEFKERINHLTVKVLEEFVTQGIACKSTCTLKFVHIFNMLDLSLLDISLVRLWAMNQARSCKANNVVCGVVDPLQFTVDNLMVVEGRNKMEDCLFNALRVHKDKNYMLVPYKTV